LIVAVALLLLALVMLWGFLGSDLAVSATSIIALLITVVLPGSAGVVLLRRHIRNKGAIGDRKELLRKQTLEAEVLRLAAQHGGKLTIVETVTDLAITPEAAKEALDELARRGLADFEVTESGVVVYAFHDVQRLSEKPHSKGILE
jgi:predicted DNA-binding transcriptional regulator